MRIAFYPQSCVPFHAETLAERPLGGIETGIIRLAQALSGRGHEVVVYTAERNPPKSTPPFLPLEQARHMQPVDAFIAVREWFPLLASIPCRKRFMWTGDSFDQVQSFGIGDKRVARIVDGLLLVSEWHADSFCAASGFPREKVFVLRNGVHLPDFQAGRERGRKRLIYSSTPFRGLELLPRIFPEIQKEHPDAELHIFSSFDVYKRPGAEADEREAQYRSLFDALRKMSGVYVHGSVIQKELALEYLSSSILVYPNTFDETSCITAMEAQAAGCVVVSSARAGLVETVGDAGILITEEAGTAPYQEQFVAAINRLLSDDELFLQLSERGIAKRREMSWETSAVSLERYLRDVHGLDQAEKAL